MTSPIMTISTKSRCSHRAPSCVTLVSTVTVALRSISLVFAIAVFLMILLSTGLLRGAIEIEMFSPATNDRFANDSSFVAAGFDLSGVGRALSGSVEGGGHWATLIDENIFLSAEHYHAPNAQQIFFYPNNDPGSPPVIRTVVGGQQIGTSDLWIGHLDFAVPSYIATYSWWQTPVTTANFSSTIEDEFVYMSGVSPTNTGYGTSKLTNQAVGENRVEDYFPNVDPLPVGGNVGDTVWLVDNLPGDAGFIVDTYEAKLNIGDSGSPLFTVNGGNLEIVGTAWLVGEVDIDPGIGETLRDFSAYAYTGNYVPEIQQYIDANLTTVVPEPASLSVMAGMCLLLLFSRAVWRLG